MKEQTYLNDPRFMGIRPFSPRIWLSSPTMHGEEQKWVEDAIRQNWVSCIGENVDACEAFCSSYTGRKYAVALSNGTAALHLAIRLAASRYYGLPADARNILAGKKVFCTDMTFAATLNPVAYEGGEAIFIDSEYETWNMDPVALEKAFLQYPDVHLVVYTHLYGTMAKVDLIRQICRKYDAVLVEDAAEALGSSYKSRPAGSFGDCSILSFNGNKIITGSAGGIYLTDNEEDASTVRRWSTQSCSPAPWYQHDELGYNYRMSNIVAGVLRGQIPYLEEHIAQKQAVYKRYRDGLKDLPVQMNPIGLDNSTSNCWLSCLVIHRDAMCTQSRSAREATYIHTSGKSCPTEILEALEAFNAMGRPIWKPMHMQPIYQNHGFISAIDGMAVDEDIFQRGLCLPSDNKMTEEQQRVIIDIIHRCFE